MAYRQLYVGDLVRIVDINHPMHGFDVVVIDAHEHYARVQFNQGNTQCYNIPNKNLLVRDSPYYFIVDGRIDHAARALHQESLRREVVDSVVDDDECEYDGWDRDDLIERIKELEREIEANS